MQKIGWVFLLILIAIFVYTPYYIPQNQLTVHRGSARLTRMKLPKSAYGFSLQYLDISKSRGEATVPFLFIHGHRGSVKQAISMNQFFSNKGLSIDMYSVDFKEGAVGVSDSLLREEADFIKLSLIEIANKYPNKKIGLIAHSMGGIAVSLALSLPDAPVDKILTLISLSTPFEVHPLNLYIDSALIYKQIHDFWRDPKNSHIFVLSVSGGVRDTMVPPQLTNIEVYKPTNSLHIYSTQIEGLHKEMDHFATVWALEFFSRLTKVIKHIINNKPEDVKTVVKNSWTNRMSRMINYEQKWKEINKNITIESDPIEQDDGKIRVEGYKHYNLPNNNGDGLLIVVCSVPIVLYKETRSVLELETASLVFEEEYYYKINVKAGDSYLYMPTDDSYVLFQFISAISNNYSFMPAALFGIHNKIEGKTTLATHIHPGKEFSQSRYAIRIKIHSGGQIKGALASCAHEELVKFNETDFTLYFHEYCENGPDIWIFGYDREFNYTLEFKIDIAASLILLARDLKTHVVSAFVFFELFVIIENLYRINRYYFLGVFGACLYFGDQFFRVNGLLGYDEVRDVGLKLGIIDILFIHAMGLGLFAFFRGLFSVLKYISHMLFVRIPKQLLLYSFLISPLIYYYPWPVMSLFALISLEICYFKPKFYVEMLFFSFTLFNFTIFKQVGWYIVIQDYGIIEKISIWDAFNIISYLFLVFILAFSQRIPNIKYDLLFIAFYIGCCAQDILYRINVILGFSCIWLGFRIIFAKKDKIKE
ncbi:unnamed protein product [Blepharisma stoltei]|uniref:GPI inositol-deacylase n=1 Tax=Blepharisma stoltei TaxID=1481888 RepID=A0AAU9I9E3_9CILI|nr:unnamed protein product [Blepharisma stoltei]